MKLWDAFMDKWYDLKEAFTSRKKGKKAEGNLFLQICRGIYRFRGVILAVTVLILAIVVAVLGLTHLPDTVGLNLQSDGSFSMMVPKAIAVMLPFLITLVSLFFLVISKRVLYPWLISLFTLALPVVIYITNVFPA